MIWLWIAIAVLQAPATAADVCGNGKIGPRGYQQVCASCIPGRACPCGWQPQMEECDQGDLGGMSCQTLGFVAGTLRCTSDCTLDKSDCQTAARVHVTTSSTAGAPRGRDFALARNGDVLGIAATETGSVRFRMIDALTLQGRSGESIWAPPPNYPKDAIGLDRVNRAWMDPLWSPVLAPAGATFLLAVEQSAYDAYLVRTFRPAAGTGALGAPVATFPGRRPRFLVPGKGAALLGFEWKGLAVVRLDDQGAPIGQPVTLPVLPRQLGQRAAALWTGDGWTIAASPEHWNERDARISIARVSANGAVGAHQELEARGVVGAISASRDGAIIYFSDDRGVAFMSVPRAGTPGKPVRLALPRPAAPLAVEEKGDVTVLWVDAGRDVERVVIRRSAPPEVAPMFAVPGKAARAAVSQGGVFHVVFGAEMGDPAPVLSVAK